MRFLEQDWVSCGINLDEDIHFSTTYLRMSLDKNIGEIFEGYSCFLSIYQNFNEEYYLLKDECYDLAHKLVQKICDSPTWFQHILDETMNKSYHLHQIICNNKSHFERLSALSNLELERLYVLIYKSTLDLYKYARVPEILDRGVSYYSNYLLEYLRDVFHKEDVYDEFASLTTSNADSIYKMAEKRRLILREMAIAENLENISIRDFRLQASYDLRRGIKEYCNDWNFLYYHGYGSKRILTEDEVINDIISRDSESMTGMSINVNQMWDKISSQFKLLFEFYPVIANVKLYRKYYQTETFYYLDKILEEVANRMTQPMNVIRSMLPEEVRMFLNNGIIDISSIRKRIPVCIYYDDGYEHVETDSLIINEAKVLLRKNEGQYEEGKYHGFPVSKGDITGRAVYYRRDGVSHKFHKNEIVLCEAVDPDMFDEIMEAGAVLSVQGGVTSHAAIFCRENHIPAIGGIANLFDMKEQSWIRVDAFHGDVFVKGDDTNYHPLGMKARNLEWLKQNGFNVPDFFVESYTVMKEKITDEIEFETWLTKAYFFETISDEELLIIRSSAKDEDREEKSNAGKYVSIPNIKKGSLLAGIKSFIELNDKLNYDGDIIIQIMLPYDFCGVAVTGDSNLENNDSLIIEVSHGPTNLITEGKDVAVRAVFDLIHDEYKSIENLKKENIPHQIDLNFIIAEIKKARVLYGKKVDIEWGFYKDKIYLYQIRKIVNERC